MTSAWRRLLLPFVPLYAGVVIGKRWLHDRGVLTRRRLRHPVVSVGSLSAGGAGKTPVVLLLAELLGARGYEVRILTRGYGRTSTLTEEVDPTGDAARFGDEPLLLARRAAGARVFAGSDRFEAGVLAEQNERPDTKAVYLLDDGFQHQRLAREVEILLLTRRDFEDSLLPAGNLREPLRAMRSAHLLLVREDEPELPGAINRRFPSVTAPVLTIRRRIRIADDSGRPSRAIAFCGLARPEGFIEMASQAGVDIAHEEIFPDHHRYSMADIERLVYSAQQKGADGFVTTEKDAVKLTPQMRERLESIGPVAIAVLEVELLNEASAIDTIVARLASHVA